MPDATPPDAAALPAQPTPPAPPALLTLRRALIGLGLLLAFGLTYLLRGVIVPLFLAFLLAYALDPVVGRLSRLGLRRAAGAILVMLGIAAGLGLLLVYAVPLFLDELTAAATDFPDQVQSLERRVEPWMWNTLHVKLPHSLAELGHAVGERVEAELPSMLSAAALALFGTLSYLMVLLSALIVPVFALYLLIDFDRIVRRLGDLVPRRWHPTTADIARQVHVTLGGYVRGQLTVNLVLSALYAMALRLVDLRLAVPIGILTGMLAFVPYVGFLAGLALAMVMATLDWHGLGTLAAVPAVMFLVQLLDAMLVTPRIVGRSVGLAPLEVLVTMMASASLFGFLGVLLAVPLGAVVKILLQRAVHAYMRTAFYRRAP